MKSVSKSKLSKTQLLISSIQNGRTKIPLTDATKCRLEHPSLTDHSFRCLTWMLLQQFPNARIQLEPNSFPLFDQLNMWKHRFKPHYIVLIISPLWHIESIANRASLNVYSQSSVFLFVWLHLEEKCEQECLLQANANLSEHNRSS